VPLELHAAQVYTRAMYERFSKELFKSGKFACADEPEAGNYRVILLDYGPYMDHGLVEYRVGSNPSATDFFCQCKRFEHCGIPCRHILKVQFCLCCQLVSDLFPDDIILTLLSVWLSGSDPSWFH